MGHYLLSLLAVCGEQVFSDVRCNPTAPITHGYFGHKQLDIEPMLQLFLRWVVCAVEHIAHARCVERHVGHDAIVVSKKLGLQQSKLRLMLVVLLHKDRHVHRWQQVVALIPRVCPTLKPVIYCLPIVRQGFVLGMVSKQVLNVPASVLTRMLCRSNFITDNTVLLGS